MNTSNDLLQQQLLPAVDGLQRTQLQQQLLGGAAAAAGGGFNRCSPLSCPFVQPPAATRWWRAPQSLSRRITFLTYLEPEEGEVVCGLVAKQVTAESRNLQPKERKNESSKAKLSRLQEEETVKMQVRDTRESAWRSCRKLYKEKQRELLKSKTKSQFNKSNSSLSSLLQSQNK